MKKITLTIIAAMLGALIASGAQATVPELIPVQGVLTDGDGEFVDGATSMTFAIYNASDASSSIWTETQTVDVGEGFFTAYLGSTTALVVADLVSPSELWLGVTVESDDEMDRVQMAAVPFAIEAQRCQQVGNLTESDIFSTETDLTTLLDDNYAPTAHNHDSDYAPISHVHSWTTLTDIPSGFADDIDNVGFTTEGELTSLLNDNYSALGHGHVADYGTAHTSSGAAITSGDNYRLPSGTINLANGGQCIVTATAVLDGFDGGETVSGPWFRTAYQQGSSSAAADPNYGGYIIYPGTGLYAIAPTAMHVYNLTAGTNYQFGCAMLGSVPSNWVGDYFWCRVSWLCIED